MSVKIVFDDVDEFTQFISNTARRSLPPGFIQALVDGFSATDSDSDSDSDAPETTYPAVDPVSVATETNLVTNYATLQVGDRVRWEGRSIQADGEVVEVSTDDDVTVVRIRRDDTGKTFKITFDDEPTFGKMYRL